MKKQIRQFLLRQSTLTLGTVSQAGAPAAADLYFAADHVLNLFFVSEPGSRHAQNIAANAEVAATVHAPAWDWRDIKGVQLEGRCEALTGKAERVSALARYSRKFGFVSSLSAAKGASFLARHNVYRIVPHWIRWLDNRVAFAYRDEWVLEAGEWQRGIE